MSKDLTNPNASPHSSDLLIYQAPDGKIKIDVRLEGETVWLTQKQLAVLFGKSVPTINEHIKNIFREGELEESVIRNFRITAADGKSYDMTHYNLGKFQGYHTQFPFQRKPT